MFKWILILVGALTVSGLAGAVFVVNQSFNVSAEEAARQSRFTLQIAQQRFELLKKAENQQLLSSLALDRDSFNVKLALAITEISDPANNLSLQFEQETVGNFVYPDSDMEIGIIKLDVSFSTDYTPTALGVLKDISAQVGAWPAEVRGCELFRMPVNGVSVNCIYHIYHWVVHDGPVTL